MAKLRPNQFLLPSGALVTEHPIIFQTEMVRAILEGRKTQTRREIKNIHIEDGYAKGTVNFECKKKEFYEAGINVSRENLNFPFVGLLDLCKYGKVGDLIWVKETWAIEKRKEKRLVYKCRLNDFPIENDRWKPSIHLPKASSRIWAMIEDIRVERVQDISESDAMAEGVIEYEDFTFKNYFTKKGLRAEDGVEIVLAKGSFQSLWISINGQASWDANPWVWVIQYRLLSKTGRPSLDVIEKNFLEVNRKEVYYV